MAAQLRVLGPTRLQRTVSHGARDVHVQSKRLALLAYLALASQRGRCHRHTIIALFWPDCDEQHGRNALNQAIHGLREVLGHSVVATHGSEEVAASQTELWCDAVAFEAAAAHGRHEEALALYRGPLLDGRHVRSAPEFDQWLIAERERLRACAAEAAAALAGAAQAEGRTTRCIHWLKRLLDLSPDDEAALRQLMTLRQTGGDSVAALRDYDTFERRLSRDLRVSPSPETKALAQDIRNRLQRSGSRAVGPESPAYDQYWRGLLHWTRRNPEDLRKATLHFREAIARDPACAQLHAALAMAMSVLGAAFYDVEPPSRVYPDAKAALLEALTIDPENPEALASLAVVRALYDWDWHAADIGSAQACAAAPHEALVHHARAIVLVYSGRVDGAIASIRRAARLEPFVLGYQEILGFYLYMARRYQEALEQLRRTLEIDSRLYLAQLALGHTAAALGQWRDATIAYNAAIRVVGRRPYPLASLAILLARISQRRSALKVSHELMACTGSRGYVRPTYVAAVHAALGNHDATFTCLERAIEERDTHLPAIVIDPFFDPVRKDRRYRDVVRRVGLAERRDQWERVRGESASGSSSRR